MNTILASSSPYRQRLLQRLQISFSCVSPNIDETPHHQEEPITLAKRLSQEKAEVIHKNHPDDLIIASDQVAVLNNQIIGKPGTQEKACHQLQQASGQKVTFLTGLCLIHPNQPQPVTDVVPFHVHFRELSRAETLRYLEADKPYDCAGSFKWEQLGISLFERMEGKDPTALEGLPLITLSRRLRELGMQIP